VIEAAGAGLEHCLRTAPLEKSQTCKIHRCSAGPRARHPRWLPNSLLKERRRHPRAGPAIPAPAATFPSFNRPFYRLTGRLCLFLLPLFCYGYGIAACILQVIYRREPKNSEIIALLILCHSGIHVKLKMFPRPAPVESKANKVRTANPRICAIGEICGAWGLRLSPAATLLV